MEQFKRQLSYSLTPMDQLFLKLGQGRAAGVEGLFTSIGLRLSHKDGCTLQFAFAQSLQRTEKLNLSETAASILLDFSGEFGRLGIDESVSCVEKTISYLKEELNRLCAFNKDRLKCLVMILLCTGLALAVILI